MCRRSVAVRRSGFLREHAANGGKCMGSAGAPEGSAIVYAANARDAKPSLVAVVLCQGAVDDYAAFLLRKRIIDEPSGFEPGHLPAALFDWQREIVEWACRRGRAAIFADCGLGKTPMQLAWADQVVRHTGGRVLILAPLAVSAQTVREGAKFGVPVRQVRTDGDVHPGVSITNYERLGAFSPGVFAGLVLDESSILKDFTGTTRRAIQAFADLVPHRLACTATPAPNELMELTNHSEFVGALRGREILAEFFIGDQDPGGKMVYRLKSSARGAFFEWLASWAVALRTPADLGYPAEDFALPALEIHHHTTDLELVEEGLLFGVGVRTLADRRAARRESLVERVERVAALVAAEPGEQWIVWCELNDESTALTHAIPGAVEVRGPDAIEHKERAAAEGQLSLIGGAA